jgi:hypothetical protein
LARSICTVEDCEKPISGEGYCSKHLYRFRRYGSPLALKPKRTCSVTGCEDKHAAKGYCAMHYQRSRGHGNLHRDMRATGRKQCQVEDCGGVVVGHGYCNKHFLRYQKYGSPYIVRPCRTCGSTNDAPSGSWCLKCIEDKFRLSNYRMIGKFVDRMTPVEAQCLTCGRTSTPMLINVASRSRCVWCAREINRNRQAAKKTPEAQVRQELAGIGLEMLGPYLHATAPIDARCTRCNTRVAISLNKIRSRLQSGRQVFGCQKCRYRAARIPVEDVRERCTLAGYEYIDGFTTIRNRINVKCLSCSRIRNIVASSILILGNRCWYCMQRTIYNPKKIAQDPELATAPAFVYIFEFIDDDGIAFRKFGIGRKEVRGEGRIRTHRRHGGTLIQYRENSLLICAVAEEMIRIFVGEHAYIPRHQALLNGGWTECYHAHVDVNLGLWVKKARASITNV